MLAPGLGVGFRVGLGCSRVEVRVRGVVRARVRVRVDVRVRVSVKVRVWLTAVAGSFVWDTNLPL